MVNEILKDLIQIDSQCTKSNKEIIDYIKLRLGRFETTIFPLEKVDPISGENIPLYNLVVKIPGKGSNKPLVFVGHTDTVPIAKGWSKNPLKVSEDNSCIYGLGASDMKAGLACMINGALNIKDIPENDIYLLFDADEEGSLTGGLELVKQFKLKGANVIVAEPTDEEIIYAQKGCLDVLFEFEGISLHSSKTNLKNNLENNAIYKAILFCNKLIEYEREIESVGADDLFGKPSFNIGFMSGGTAPNAVPDFCKVHVSRRLIPSEDINSEFLKLKEMASKVDNNVKVQATFYGKTFMSDIKSKFAKELQELSKKYFSKDKFNVHFPWTEAALFSDYGDVFIFGPGHANMCHRVDEYVEKENLQKFSQLYIDLMNLN